MSGAPKANPRSHARPASERGCQIKQLRKSSDVLDVPVSPPLRQVDWGTTYALEAYNIRCLDAIPSLDI